MVHHRLKWNSWKIEEEMIKYENVYNELGKIEQQEEKQKTKHTQHTRDPVLFIVDVVFAENCLRSAQPISNELLK